MLDLSIIATTKRHISRANKLEKVNLESEHIVKVLNGLMAAAVPQHIVMCFRNTFRRSIHERRAWDGRGSLPECGAICGSDTREVKPRGRE
jgi:hypothetical protein